MSGRPVRSSHAQPLRAQGLWPRVMAALAMLACLLSLVAVQAPALADTLASAVAQPVQEPARAAAECGAADIGCQDLAEREFTLPETVLAATERPYLVPASLQADLVQMALAPPERPPRLQA